MFFSKLTFKALMYFIVFVYPVQDNYLLLKSSWTKAFIPELKWPRLTIFKEKKMI